LFPAQSAMNPADLNEDGGSRATAGCSQSTVQKMTADSTSRCSTAAVGCARACRTRRAAGLHVRIQPRGGSFLAGGGWASGLAGGGVLGPTTCAWCPHLRARAVADQVLIETGPLDAPIARIRLRKISAEDWCVEMLLETRWEKTPNVGPRGNMVAAICDLFSQHNDGNSRGDTSDPQY
jgi:hypothetical protein